MPDWIADPRSLLGDAQLSRLPRGAQLLYLRLRLWGDSERQCYANPTTIKGSLFPHDSEATEAHIIEWLDQLERKRYIRFYSSDGQDYLVWQKHTVQMSRKPKAELPDPPAGYYEKRYRPDFLPSESPMDKTHHDNGEPAPDSGRKTGTNNTCCLLDKASDFGLTPSNAKGTLNPYCEMRKRQGSCVEANECYQDIMLVVGKVRAHNPTRYTVYLMKALQEDLPRCADKALAKRQYER